MKKIVIVFLFLFSAIQVYSQEQNQLEEIMNISLEKYFEIKIGPVNDSDTSEDLSEDYLSLENLPPNFEVSQKVKDTGIRLIDLSDKYNKKIFNKPKGVFWVSYPFLEGNTLRIGFTSSGVRKKGGRLMIGMIDTFYFYWQYSSEKGYWKLMHVSRGIFASQLPAEWGDVIVGGPEM